MRAFSIAVLSHSILAAVPVFGSQALAGEWLLHGSSYYRLYFPETVTDLGVDVWWTSVLIDAQGSFTSTSDPLFPFTEVGGAVTGQVALAGDRVRYVETGVSDTFIVNSNRTFGFVTDEIQEFADDARYREIFVSLALKRDPNVTQEKLTGDWVLQEWEVSANEVPPPESPEAPIGLLQNGYVVRTDLTINGEGDLLVDGEVIPDIYTLEAGRMVVHSPSGGSVVDVPLYLGSGGDVFLGHGYFPRVGTPAEDSWAEAALYVMLKKPGAVNAADLVGDWHLLAHTLERKGARLDASYVVARVRLNTGGTGFMLPIRQAGEGWIARENITWQVFGKQLAVTTSAGTAFLDVAANKTTLVGFEGEFVPAVGTPDDGELVEANLYVALKASSALSPWEGDFPEAAPPVHPGWLATPMGLISVGDSYPLVYRPGLGWFQFHAVFGGYAVHFGRYGADFPWLFTNAWMFPHFGIPGTNSWFYLSLATGELYRWVADGGAPGWRVVTD